jgi:putative spermidine/putrescine transport system permease protein
MTRSWRDWALYAVTAVVGFVLIAPTLVIVPMSFSAGRELRFPPRGLSTRWYTNFFADETWLYGAITSATVALWTVVIATVLGTITALGVVRGRYPGRALVNAIVLGPLLVPIVLLAVGMFFVLSQWRLSGTLPGLVLAHAVLAMPLVVVTVGTSLRAVDPNLEMAAQNLGAGPLRTFWRITFPLIRPGIVAGALFAFITSWDEVVIAIFQTSPLFRTLPVVMWSQVRSQVDPTIAAAATMLTLLTAAILLAVYVVNRRAAART